MQICTSPQADNHGSTLTTSCFTGWMAFLPPNQSIKALKALLIQCSINNSSYNNSVEVIIIVMRTTIYNIKLL